ncbi:MAG: D-glycero-beta-D-manno-heptose-7-phosphate kinase [bacterium]
MRRLINIVENFAGRRVLVIGDCMLDEYVYGDCSRISPEAPIPVFLQKQARDFPGGATNVSANIKAVGGEPIVVGVVGNDLPGKRLVEVMKEKGIDDRGIVESDLRRTTVKTRIVARGQQMIRIDKEIVKELSPEESESIKERIEDLISSADSIIISDYGKGMITRDIIQFLLEHKGGRDIKIVVDPKVNHFDLYRSMTIITPNHREASSAIGFEIVDVNSMVKVGKKLLGKVDCENVLITWGEMGMVLFQRNNEPVFIPATARSVYDVTGAGDTVVAILALALASGADIEDASRIANFAGGIVVEKAGTSVVYKEELIIIIEENLE